MDKRIKQVTADFEAMLNDLGIPFTHTPDNTYPYSLDVPKLGRLRVNLDLVRSGTYKRGLWVHSIWDNVRLVVDLFGNRYDQNPDHLFADRLNPHSGKFNFFDSHGDFTGFEVALTMALKKVRGEAA